MRIQTRLLFILLIVAVVPVAISGITALTLNRRVLTQHINRVNVVEARALAENIDQTLAGALGDLRLIAEAVPATQMSPEEQLGVLQLVYRLNDGFNIVSLIDRSGQNVGPLVFSNNPGQDLGASHHHPVNPAELATFSQNIPLTATQTAGAAVGPVYVSAKKGIALVVLAVLLPGPSSEQDLVLAVEIALDGVSKRVQETANASDASVYLIDSRGRVIAHSLAEVALSRSDFSDREPVKKMLGEGLDSFGVLNYSMSGVMQTAAFARLDRLPWGVVVEKPESQAFASVSRIAKQTIFWVSVALICALAAGLVLSRSIGGPVRALDRAAEALKRGDLSSRAQVQGHDELARLAETFNSMAVAIAKRDEALRAFAEQLQQRVDERTKELRQAQEQLLQSEKLAAVGELGAGVAHEINNPLAGLLGTAQLLLLRLPKDDPNQVPLKSIESEALRIREIVQNLLQLAQGREESAGALVDANKVLEAALGLVTRPIIAQRIKVKKEFASKMPKIRIDPSELQQIFMHLLSNAKNAMPKGGDLLIRSEVVDDKLVLITISDTGIGIRREDLEKIFEPFFTRKEDWSGKGLGLSVAHRGVEQAGGRIRVESERGHGASFVMTFPVARDNLHLT